jgi:hypothetical protein
MAEPSPFFRQHHAVEAPAIDQWHFRTYYRVWTRLDQLKADRAISPYVWLCGCEYRRIAELVLSDEFHPPNFEYGGMGHNSRGTDFDPSRGRIDAGNHKAEIRKHLGGFAINLLELHLVGDLPWETLGKLYGVHRKTVKRWTIECLDGLAFVVWPVMAGRALPIVA